MQGLKASMQRFGARSRLSFRDEVWIPLDPAHASLEDAVYRGPLEGPPFLCALGNAWADFFAKQGAAESCVGQGIADLYRFVLKEAQELSKYLAWAGRRVVDLGLCGSESSEVVRRSPEANPPLPSGSLVTIDDAAAQVHDVWFSPSLQEWRCKNCGVATRSRHGLRHLRSPAARCAPNDLQKW